MLPHGDRVVAAAFDGGVVGDNQTLGAVEWKKKRWQSLKDKVNLSFPTYINENGAQ